MAVIIGNGAFRIWVGKDKQTGLSNNIGIRIMPQKFPTGVNVDAAINKLVPEIEQLIRKECPWV
jgi:hypothetical protein